SFLGPQARCAGLLHDKSSAGRTEPPGPAREQLSRQAAAAWLAQQGWIRVVSSVGIYFSLFMGRHFPGAPRDRSEGPRRSDAPRRPPRPSIRYIHVGVEMVPRPAKSMTARGESLTMAPVTAPTSPSSGEEPHVLLRLRLPLDCGPEGRRPGRRPAALGALLPPADRPGPQEAPVRPPPRRRRAGRGPERLPQLLPRRGPGPLPPARRPRQPVAAAGGHHRQQSPPPAQARVPPKARRWHTAGPVGDIPDRSGRRGGPGAGRGRGAHAGLRRPGGRR